MGETPLIDGGDKYQQTRREFLGTVGIGLSGTLSNPTHRRRTRIVKARDANQNPIQTTKVSTRWMKQTKLVDKYIDDVKRRYLGKNGVHRIGITGIESPKFGPKVPVPVIVTNGDPAQLDLPKSLSTITSVSKSDLVSDTITFREGTKSTSTVNACHGSTIPSPYPGGLPIIGGDITDRYKGTGGYRAIKNGSEYLITANHVTGNCPGLQSNIIARWHSYNWEDIGTVEEASLAGDWAAVTTNNHGVTDLSNEIFNFSSTKQIGGYKTNHGIKHDLLDATVKKHGGATGYSEGKIIDHELSGSPEDSCVNFGGAGMLGEMNCAGGDSGCPLFETHVGSFSSYQIIWGHLSAQTGQTVGTSCIDTTIEEKSLGVAGYALVNTAGFSIG